MADESAAFLRAQAQADHGGQYIEHLQAEKQADGWGWKRAPRSNLSGVNFSRYAAHVYYLGLSTAARRGLQSSLVIRSRRAPVPPARLTVRPLEAILGRCPLPHRRPPCVSRSEEHTSELQSPCN